MNETNSTYRASAWSPVQSTKLNPLTIPFRPHLPSFHCSFTLSLLISLSLLGGWFVSLRWLLFGGAHGGQPPITAAGSESSKANQPRSSAPQIKIKLFYFSLWAPFAPPQEWNHSLRSFIHSLGPLTPQHTSFQSFFPLGREEWNEMKVLLMARGVIIAGINQLSFIIQNKVFHYCRQQVYSCSNNCTVIISFHSLQ